MLKGNRKYYIVLAAIFITVVTLQYLQPKPINWNRTYLQKDKIPFGCYAIFQLLEKTYAPAVSINKEPLYNFGQHNQDTAQTMLLLDEQLALSKLETHILMDFIRRGNKVMLCAQRFSGHLADTFKLKTSYNWFESTGSIDSLLKKPSYRIRFVQPANNQAKPYTYTEASTESYLSRFDTALFRIRALSDDKHAVLLSAHLGKGELVVCSTPDAFANVFVVNHPNRFYPYTILSMLRNKTIIWDEYYKSYNNRNTGILKFILDSDALYMAYCILILGLITFMVFEMKRRQRPIPVVTPPVNSTLEFVDVISNVYFNSRNHMHIAEEKINYFYFEIRQKFQVSTHTIDDAFYDTISRLSGISKDEVRGLFVYCEQLKQAPSLNESDLIELNNRIHKFKLKSIR